MIEPYQLDEFERIAECRICDQTYVFKTLLDRAHWLRTHHNGDHEKMIHFYSQQKHPEPTTP
jgi:hypothetical protein